MTSHPQYITVRNQRGADMLAALGGSLQRLPPVSSGDRRPLVMQVGGWVGRRGGCRVGRGGGGGGGGGGRGQLCS
jgi:hypothetical protein